MGKSKMRLAWKEVFWMGVWGMCRGDYKAGLLPRISPGVRTWVLITSHRNQLEAD